MSNHSLFTLLILTLLLALLPEYAVANKFVTIGGGVSGASHEKFDILKRIASYSGLFFILLGILSVITRNRFEGFLGMRKKGEEPSIAPYVLMVIGALLSGLFFI